MCGCHVLFSQEGSSKPLIADLTLKMPSINVLHDFSVNFLWNIFQLPSMLHDRYLIPVQPGSNLSFKHRAHLVSTN